MTIYERVVRTSKPYLGPATEQFLVRQCKAHLHIDAKNLEEEQLTELATWVESGAALIMDAGKAKELAQKIATS